MVHVLQNGCWSVNYINLVANITCTYFRWCMWLKIETVKLRKRIPFGGLTWHLNERQASDKSADRYKFQKYVSITRNSLYKSSRQWNVYIRMGHWNRQKITITRNCWQFNASAYVVNWRNICLFVSHSANLLNLYLIRRRPFQRQTFNFSSIFLYQWTIQTK